MLTYEVVQHRTWSLPFLALVCSSLVTYCAGAAAGAAGAAGVAPFSPTIYYEAVFTSPWNGDRSNNGLQHLEHVNICVPSHDPAKHLYYELLGLVPDARRAQNIGKGSGTIWANIGTNQIHLPVGEPQVVPGTIGLVYDSGDLVEVLTRLKSATSGDVDRFDGTEFGWREAKGGEEKANTLVEVTCPYGERGREHRVKQRPAIPATATATAEGNVFRLHERKASFDRESAGALDPRGGRLPNVPVAEGTSPISPLGLGIAYVSFRARPGTAGGIARFYREVFSTEAKEIGGNGPGGDVGDGGDASCAAEGGTGVQTCSMGEAKTAVVRVGPVQYLAFVERGGGAPPKEYDGHHVCVYLSEEGFRHSFVEAERLGLVFVNPRRNHGKADTLEKALEEKQFRIKNMVDPATGELLHELEHEIRSVAHPSYPVGRDLSAETPTKT
ncbi:unnamed protein product [Pylaiella littoralis]